MEILRAGGLQARGPEGVRQYTLSQVARVANRVLFPPLTSERLSGGRFKEATCQDLRFRGSYVKRLYEGHTVYCA